MKNIIIGIAIFATSLAACNSSSNKSNESQSKSDTTQAKTEIKNDDTKGTASINNIVSGYLQLKNALANDNGSDAANAGKVIMDAVDKFDKSSLSAEQKKSFEDVADDIK